MESVAQLKEHLVPKLAERGMSPGAIPLFIRGLALAIEDDSAGHVADVNGNLRRLGWDGLDMDRDELHHVITCLGTAGLKKLRQKPARWFFKAFELPDDHPPQAPSFEDAETDPAFNNETIIPAASSGVSLQE